jgi:hypothetical protein
MTAWELLIAHSTLASGDAWEHLNAQGGGSGEIIYMAVENMDVVVDTGGIDVEVSMQEFDVEVDVLNIEVTVDPVDIEVPI